MKNKLLVSVFAVGLTAFALTSCESKSDVTGVCTDMLKETMHKCARSLETPDGQTLMISEYEFLGGVNDNRMVYRSISFGNGMYLAKKVDSLTYEYGGWSDDNTYFTLLVTPAVGDPYTLTFQGNSFITPDKRVFGGDVIANTARVDKWESVINTLPNTTWEATFKDEFVTDSVFRDSIKQTPVPPMGVRYDTIPIFDHLDTLSADTTCYYRWEFKRNPSTLENTGHLYRKGVRTTYDRETKKETVVKEEIKEFDFNWFFSTVNSDTRFHIAVQNTTSGSDDQSLNISKYTYKVQPDTIAPEGYKIIHEFTLGGLVYTPYVPVP